jgi:DNA gyrase subunit B
MIRLVDQRQGKEEEFAFAGGVGGFVEYINKSKTVIHPTVVYASGEREVDVGSESAPGSAQQQFNLQHLQ